MTRPRKPFGHHQPGRLPSTMMKVLAAEMSDPARLRRGKQYAKDGSVLDIIIEPGVVTCEVQGSRSTPYIASLEVTAGDGMPLRRDVHTSCTCPDDDNWDDYACKHAIATMFAFADELLIEPELLDVWRNNEAVHDRDGDPDVEPADDGHRDVGTDSAGDGPGRRRHLQLVRDDDTPRRGDDDASRRSTAGSRADPNRVRTRDDEPVSDPIARHLAPPDGSTVPDIPRLDRIEPLLPRRPELAAVLRDAYVNLRIDWD